MTFVFRLLSIITANIYNYFFKKFRNIKINLYLCDVQINKPMLELSANDKKQLENLNISVEQVERQVNQFKTGFPFSDLVAPATIGNGIIKFSDAEVQELIKQFDEDKQYYDILKFIPASGAASRMFKSIYSFVEDYKGKEIPEDFLTKENIKNDSIENFFLSIREFAFYDDLKDKLAEQGKDIAAQGNLNVQLSDFGSVNMSGHIETAGFGGLEEGISDRRDDNLYEWSITTQFELGKLFPEKISSRSCSSHRARTPFKNSSVAG